MQDDGLASDALDIELLHVLFAAIDHASCLCEVITQADGRPVDYRFVSVNALFAQMTGLQDAPGRRALELVPDLDPCWVETYGRVVAERTIERFQSNDAALRRRFDVFAAPTGSPGRLLIVFRDISCEKRLANERELALQRAEALLQELNHRVMNSLGMIAAIIGLEGRSRPEGEGRRALARVSDRVHAVADLYRTLNRTLGISHRASEVRADEYLGELVARLAASVAEERVTISMDIEPLVLPTHVAAPLGLVVNELVTNSLKYAFGPHVAGEIVVALRCEGTSVCLSVRDDGQGMDEHAAADGIGHKLVATFAQQLGGTVRAEAGGGTSVTVTFPLPESSSQ